jgi:C-terminal processing protease CtpA/Prc
MFDAAIGKIMVIKLHSRMIYGMTHAILSAALSIPADAATPERPKEIDKVYDYQGRDLKGFGATLNADITRLGVLFGTAAEFDVSHMPREEEKGWLGIAMKLPDQSPKEPGSNRTLQAIEVTRIMPGSGAAAAGLREGDLIVGLDGAPVEDKGDKTVLVF